jgi:cobalt-zinc-cadmium efflux system protein
MAEVVYGLLAGSLALLADAGHNRGDVLGLAPAWWASALVRRGPTAKYTYGFKGSSILASLANAVFLLRASGAIAWEALGRLGRPAPVDSGVVMAVAAVGIAVNAGTALLFAAGRHRDLNVRAAFAHMAADAGLALGVVAAGLVMRLTGWAWVDPLASLALVLVIVAGTWGLLRESLDLALQAVPAGTDLAAVEAYLRGLPGVVGVHDLHVWGMSTTEAALTAHLVTARPGLDNALTARLARELHDRFGIEHPTVQFELDDGAHACPLAPPDVV